MKLDKELLQTMPEIMNKEQFRIVCHISKRTALYYLQSGLIKAENTGKKTHTWNIRKRDVIAFVRDYSDNPYEFMPPENWYVYGEPGINGQSITHFFEDEKWAARARAYYAKILEREKDLLTVKDVARITDYRESTVIYWIHNDKLHVHYAYTNRFLIPKEYLLNFLCSDFYMRYRHKPQKQMIDMCQIHNVDLDSPCAGCKFATEEKKCSKKEKTESI